MSIIYLAAPYSHPDKNVILDRVEKVNITAAYLMDGGDVVFSPISHSHPISEHCNIDPCDHDFWLKQDLPFMAVCDEMVVLTLDGYEGSKGITIELKEADRLKIPVRYI